MQNHSSVDPNSILDPKIVPFNVALFDQLVENFYNGQNNRREEAHATLNKFQTLPQSWMRAPEIIKSSRSINSKIFALNVLQKCIQTQWKVLSPEYKKGIKTFVENLIVQLSSNTTNNNSSMTPLFTKMNLVLVDIVKREWPHNWPNFISQIVQISKKSEFICANNMKLLRLLCEEASENVKDVTHKSQESLKENLHSEFNKVFELCMFVLKNSSDDYLISETLQTLCKFINLGWVNARMIYESQLLEALTLKYYGKPTFSNISLECLTEIVNSKDVCHEVSVSNKQLISKLVNVYIATVKQTMEYGVQLNTNLDVFISQHRLKLTLVQNFLNFIIAFIRNHRSILEQDSDTSREGLICSLKLVEKITQVHESNLFNICIDFWKHLYAKSVVNYINQIYYIKIMAPTITHQHL